MVTRLISEGFVNEERFARSFVRGKYRIKKWGRILIKIALSRHHLSDYCVRKGFEEIDEDEYLANLRHLTLTKWESLKEKDLSERIFKVKRYLQEKGYEFDLIQDIIDEVSTNS